MRYNIFNQIHKGLRALLYDSAVLLQCTNFRNEEDAQRAAERLQLVIALFEDHAQHEDQFILPAIARFEPSLVDAFEQEHETDLRLACNLQSSFDAVQMASEKVKDQMVRELLNCFEAFLVFNLEHMKKEETVLNKVLWRYYSDQEILDIQKQILERITPWAAVQTSTWMMRGLNNAEISKWLKSVEQTAPPEVFQQLFDLAEKELPQNRFQNVLESLTDGVMLAN